MTVDGNVRGIDLGGIQALRAREAGYSVARKCLEVQADAERSDPSLRGEHGVRLHDDARSWYVGTLGEIQVGRMLDVLGPEWLVLHSVPIGAKDTDVDHVLIGPAGVFVVNTKHHAGASVWVGDRAERINGMITHYAERSASEARNVGGRLGREAETMVSVSPVVTLVGVRGIKDSRPLDNRRVSFVPADDLVRWLVSLPERLDPVRLNGLKLAAEQPSTWHVDPRAADTVRVMPRFDRLREDVDRHLAWAAEAPDRRRFAPREARPSAARPGNTRQAPRGRSAPTPQRPTSPARTLVTVVLVVVALAILIPVVAMASVLAGSDPTAFWVVVAVVLGAVGLVAGTPVKRRKRRR